MHQLRSKCRRGLLGLSRRFLLGVAVLSLLSVIFVFRRLLGLKLPGSLGTSIVNNLDGHIQSHKPSIPSLRSGFGDSGTISKDFIDSSRSKKFDIASNIYVVSLARRTDRRREMENLRKALGLEWRYIDAVDTTDIVIQQIMQHVETERTHAKVDIGNSVQNQTSVSLDQEFRWPEDVDSLSFATEPLKPAGSDHWVSQVNPVIDGSNQTLPSNSQPAVSSLLTCATQNNTIEVYNVSLPSYMILSPAKIACWYSHLSVLRRIADRVEDDSTNGEVSIILEDDVDMELDIKERLMIMWPALPDDWDVVFLGHCWSNEAYYPALFLPSSSLPSSIHPSNAPKCTHAYALTRSGARRLLLHLRHPPFAYSRALDQAYAWLIQSGRIKAFSVVPSLVVQRKLGESDVWGDNDGTRGTGSKWKEGLVNGVFEASFIDA